MNTRDWFVNISGSESEIYGCMAPRLAATGPRNRTSMCWYCYIARTIAIWNGWSRPPTGSGSQNAIFCYSP